MEVVKLMANRKQCKEQVLETRDYKETKLKME